MGQGQRKITQKIEKQEDQRRKESGSAALLPLLLNAAYMWAKLTVKVSEGVLEINHGQRTAESPREGTFLQGEPEGDLQ